MKRRRFLQVAGVTSAGLAAGCGSGEADKWMPYLVPNEDLVPGIPTWYASSCKECPAGCGILVKTREGRPVKIEGNPEHPVNRGRLCARGQAALQGLYDPDRVTGPMQRDGTTWKSISWDDAIARIATALGAAASAGADRVALVSGAASGPLDHATDGWLAQFKSTRRLRYEAFAYEPLKEASKATFGVAGVPHNDFGAARYILSFGADFLETWLSPTSQQIGFAESHGYADGKMAKFVAIEPRRGLTGFSADEWFAPKPGTEALVALAIANAIVKGGHSHATGGDADALRGFLARFDAAAVAGQSGVPAAAIERIATEFASVAPSLAVAGGVANQGAQATQLAVAVNILNIVAGNVGHTVTFPASVWDTVATYRDITALQAAMDGGGVDVVLFHGTNPVYTVPGPGFAAALAKVKLKVAFSTTTDDTAALCDLILPDHHPLEQWDQIAPLAGVTGLVQPAIRPIHDSRQAYDVLVQIAQKAGKTVAGAATAREVVAHATPNLNAVLAKGVIAGTVAPRAVRMSRDFARMTFEPAAFGGAGDGLVLFAVPSPMLYDGRGANKSWLQEIPDPATKITWQTWAELHPRTAARLGLRSGDVVTVSAGAQNITAQVYVYPGVHPDVVAIPIGRGHNGYGRYANGLGSNPLRLLGTTTDASGALAFAQTKVTLAKTGTRPLATTEGSARQLGRGIARIATFAEAASGHIEHEVEPITAAEQVAIDSAAASQGRRTNLAGYGQPHPKWEMTIDLSRCTGCSACVAACYAENNLPSVGESQVVRSREMAWIRLERYYEGDIEGTDFKVAQVPMLCQQCANAPCEPVCPVYAAYHTPDGLNGQIYNRCVGTRYCANNCPYKVRYFNFWNYGDAGSEQNSFPGALALGLNPDVTVRTKGVMEKCTFCVQRIRFAQNDARVRGLALADDSITPACAQTCPSNAIIFGDANRRDSRVSRSKQDERGYHVFEQLNTKPGITYLARVVHAAAGEG